MPNDVVANSKDPSHWHFYEWSEGLEGELSKAIDLELANESFDAIYNLFLISALNCMNDIGKYLKIDSLLGYKEYAEKIRASFHACFWNKNEDTYASFNRKGELDNYAQLTQALALLENVVPEEFVESLNQKLKDDKELIKAELPDLKFVYDALLKYDNKNLEFVLADIKDKYGKMIYSGATSLWETVDGQGTFSNAGSLCHAWSSIFIYIAGAYILGVKPLQPGFKTILFTPDKGLLKLFRGNISTPYGEIVIESNEGKVSISKSDEIKVITHPTGWQTRDNHDH
jgi:alpha-L-rhamnosidase